MTTRRLYALASELKKGDKFRFSRHTGEVIEDVETGSGAVFFRNEAGNVESINLHPETPVRLLNG